MIRQRDGTRARAIARAAAHALAWVVVAYSAAVTAADTVPRTDRVTFGGLLFGDLYYVAQHHTADGDGASGAVLRRGYFTMNVNPGGAWRGRARLEINQDGNFETYKFDTKLKDLYLARKAGRHEVVLGLSPTLTYDLIESTWGARYLMRTPLDVQGVPSRDTGITVKGPLGGGTFGYRLMYGSGLEYANQGGGGDKFMGAVTWYGADGLYADFYADHEALPGPRDRSIVQLFVGRASSTLRWGLQYAHQDREDDPTLEVASAFIVRALHGEWSLIGRIDRLLEPSPKGDGIAYIPFDPSARATLFLGGVEYRPTSLFRVTPNVVWTTYDRNDAGTRPGSDLQLRLTLFLDME